MEHKGNKNRHIMQKEKKWKKRKKWYMIYLLTAIELTPGGSSTVHIYTQTVHRTTQNKQYIEEHNTIHRRTQQYIQEHNNNT